MNFVCLQKVDTKFIIKMADGMRRFVIPPNGW